jgi:DNA-binding transcriptional ArsR family regulator
MHRMSSMELTPSKIAKALSSPARVKILRYLEEREMCGCEFGTILGLDPSVISRHLAVLARAGLVRKRRDGVRILWRLANPEVSELLALLEKLAEGAKEERRHR